MVLVAKDKNTCPKCHQPINVGDKINWSRGRQATHGTCPVASTPPEPLSSPHATAPPAIPLPPRLQKLETIQTLFELFGEQPSQTYPLIGEALLLHLRSTPGGPQRLTALLTDEYIWYIVFPPFKRTPNVPDQGPLGLGRRLGYTPDLADDLRTLRVPGSEAFAPELRRKFLFLPPPALHALLRVCGPEPPPSPSTRRSGE